MAEARGRTLKFKTCNATQAGTVDPVSLSFCGGESDCVMGSPNAYNLRGELEPAGVWSQFEVPLEYEPTTMEMSIGGTDAWYVRVGCLLALRYPTACLPCCCSGYCSG